MRRRGELPHNRTARAIERSAEVFALVCLVTLAGTALVWVRVVGRAIQLAGVQ